MATAKWVVSGAMVMEMEMESGATGSVFCARLAEMATRGRNSSIRRMCKIRQLLWHSHIRRQASPLPFA